MGQKIVPRLTKLLPRAAGTRRFLLVLLVAIALGILAGNFARNPLAMAGSATVTDAAPASQAPPGNETAATGPEPLRTSSLAPLPSLTGIWVTLVLFMVVGMALIWLLGRNRRFRAGNGALHVVDTIPLGGRRLLHLIRCGDRKYLIGNSEKGISYLATLPQDPLEKEVDEGQRRTEGEVTFDELLSAGGPR